MTVSLSIIRLVLSAVFLWAAVAKLLDPRGAARSMRAFGAPKRASLAGAGLVTVAEIAVGALLLTGAYRWGAGGAAALLLGFAAAMAVNLARGRKPTCNCVGALLRAPIGVRHVVADVTGAGLALLLLLGSASPARIRPGGSLTAGTLLAIAFSATACVIIAALLWVVLHLWRQQGRLLVRLEQLERNAREGWAAPPLPNPRRRQAPDFTLSGPAGQRTLEGLRRRAAATVLVFTDADCATCRDYVSDLCGRRFAFPVVLIARQPGDVDGNCGAGIELLYDRNGDVADDYGVTGVPSAVLVDGRGMLPHDAAPGPQAMDRLLAWASFLTEHEESVNPGGSDEKLTVTTSGTAV